MSDPALLAFCLVVVPATGGLVVMVLPEIRARIREAAGVAFAVMTVMGAARLAYLVFAEGAVGAGRFLPFAPLPHLGLRLPGLGGALQLPLGFFVDSLSVLTVLAVAGLGLLCLLYALEGARRGARGSELYGYALWTIAAANLAVLSDNTVLLLAGWALGGPLLFLAVGASGERSREGATRALTGSGAGSLMLMCGLLVLASRGGVGGLSLSRLLLSEPMPLQGVGPLLVAAAVLLVAAAVMRMGALPGHGWAVEASAAAGQPLGALVPAGIDRLLGVYLLVRAVFGIFSWPGAEGMRSLLLLVGAAGAIGGVLGAMVQTDLRKMLAFIGVGQSGLVLMAVAGGSAAGMSGAVLQGLVAAVAVSLLFLCAGSIERRTGTTELARLGGLGRRMPMTFLAMFVAGLSAAGLPLLAGFAPRWLTCVALLDSALAPGDSPYGRFFGLVCTFGFVAVLASGLLTLAAFARLFRAVFTGPVPGCCQAARPAGPAVRFAEHGMALLLLASGILPATLLGPNGLIGRVAADAGASGLGVSRVSLAPLAGGFWNPPLVGALLLAAVCAGGVILALSRISRSRTVPPFTALVAAGGDLRGVAYPAPDFNDVAGEAPMLRLVSGLSLLRPCDWGLWAGRLATVPGWILALFFTGWFGLLLALLAGAAAVAAGAAVIAGLPWPLWAPRAVAGTGLGMFVAGALGAAFVRRPRAAASGLWVAFAGLALLSLAGAVRAGRAAETSTAAAYAREGRVIGARIERADLQARLRAVRDDIPLSGSGTVPAEADLEKRIAFLDKGIPAEGRTLEAQKRQARFFGYGKALLALGYALSMVCGALACLLLRLWAGAVERQTGGGSAGGSGGQPEAGGLWLRMPVASGCAAVGGLAMAWAPPLAGFWALLAVLGGLLISRQVQLAGAAAIGAMAVTWAVARLLGSQLFGPMPEGVIRSRGVRGVLLGLLLLVLAVACFAAGPLVARALPGLAAPLVSLLRG